jgi:general secretion pathway protein H
MRISGTGTSGFTLIEVLVVVAIAGVVMALAAVNLMPSDAEVAKRETGMVALAIEKARDAAWFGGRPTAVSFEDGRLRQWKLAGERTWEAQAERDFPEVHVTGLAIDGQAMAANQRLVFLADGLGIPFRVTLQIRGQPCTIEGDAAGAVRSSSALGL